MDFDFDLETCQVELEQVCDLLGMHLEFAEECPQGDYSTIVDRTTKAIVFASRAERYETLITTAYDKVEAIAKGISAAVNEYYSRISADRKEQTQ